jgi:hypothetical protein
MDRLRLKLARDKMGARHPAPATSLTVDAQL